MIDGHMERLLKAQLKYEENAPAMCFSCKHGRFEGEYHESHHGDCYLFLRSLGIFRVVASGRCESFEKGDS